MPASDSPIPPDSLTDLLQLAVDACFHGGMTGDEIDDVVVTKMIGWAKVGSRNRQRFREALQAIRDRVGVIEGGLSDGNR